MNRSEIKFEITRLKRTAAEIELQMEKSVDPDLEYRLYNLEKEIDYLADLYYDAEE